MAGIVGKQKIVSYTLQKYGTVVTQFKGEEACKVILNLPQPINRSSYTKCGRCFAQTRYKYVRHKGVRVHERILDRYCIIVGLQICMLYGKCSLLALSNDSTSLEL